MMRYVRDLRLIPIALIASTCLLVLKVADLAVHSSYFFDGKGAPASDADFSITRAMPDVQQPPGTLMSWAQQMFNFPDSSGSTPMPGRAPAVAPRLAELANADITGSVPTETGDGKAAPSTAPGKPASPPLGSVIPVDGAALPTGAERAILERLQERRQELDTRARELDIRESLIQGAEKRMDAHLAELKEVEGKIKIETDQKDEAEAARFKGLVTMYENMKPRDAAKIFERLDPAVLLQVASQINPRKMSDILAQMSPDSAEHLTVDLASRAQQAKQGGAAELPKIDGRPSRP